MNLEQLNVVELSSEELVETTGGKAEPVRNFAFLNMAWTDAMVYWDLDY
ncbi:hypothetical protein [Algoriphagus resistens]|nr:hypothetical protein [Algoriphagus resistens]